MSTKILNRIKPQLEDNEFVSVGEEFDDNEDNGGSDEEVNHSKLINDISLLDSKNKKSLKWKAKRFEANKDINELNISKGSKQISINELLKSVNNSSGGVTQLRHWHKKRTLETPLSKPIAEKARRLVAYEETSKQLSKWDPVVESNRNATQMEFPLKQEMLRLEPTRELVKQFKPKTKLELEVSELLNKSENTLKDDSALTVAEEKILKAMSLEDARLRHKELQRMRALLSYEEMRLKRQSKIKSKRYHRILKRERLKKSLETFETQTKSDPKQAIDKLNELEKLRALERASLKHKNTGKWAKHLKLRAKYDESARTALAEQMQISQKLLKKKVRFESEDESEDNDKNDSESEDLPNEAEDEAKDSEFVPFPSEYNPWMRNGRQNQPKPETNEDLNDEPINSETFGAISEEEVPIPMSRVIEEESSEPKAQTAEEMPTDVQIDPNDFIAVKSHKIKSSVPDLVTELDSDAESADESVLGSDDEQRKLVSEAFADDDVVNDFKKGKLEKIENEGQKDINLHLPGWGSWAGTGLRQSKRKIKRYTIKGKKKERKDNKLGNVIISEKNDETIAKYRVSQLPFPFKNVTEFEKSIRQPIGRTWNPETSFRHLTEPKVLTKMGTIIDPIDSEALINAPKDQRHKILRKGRKRKTQKSVK